MQSAWWPCIKAQQNDRLSQCCLCWKWNVSACWNTHHTLDMPIHLHMKCQPKVWSGHGLWLVCYAMVRKPHLHSCLISSNFCCCTCLIMSKLLRAWFAEAWAPPSWSWAAWYLASCHPGYSQLSSGPEPHTNKSLQWGILPTGNGAGQSYDSNNIACKVVHQQSAVHVQVQSNMTILRFLISDCLRIC